MQQPQPLPPRALALACALRWRERPRYRLPTACWGVKHTQKTPFGVDSFVFGMMCVFLEPVLANGRISQFENQWQGGARKRRFFSRTVVGAPQGGVVDELSLLT